MADEVRLQILDCMKWDRDVIDDIRANEQTSDRARNLLQAIKDHSDEYAELLKS